MSQDIFITLASLLGAAVGAAQINGARDDDATAQALRSEAQNFHDASRVREQGARLALGLSVGALDALRHRCWADVIAPFASALGRVRRVELAADDAACEPRPTAPWVLPFDQTLQPIEPGPMPAGVGGAGAAVVTGLSVLGAASVFGTAGTGTPIRSLHGAAKDSARDAWLGGGPTSKGGGGVRRGQAAPYVAAVGGGLFVTGHLLAARAAENLAVARQEHARACAEAQLLDARRDRHDLRRRAAAQYHAAIERLVPRAHEALGRVHALIASHGLDYPGYDRATQGRLHLDVETVRALKALLSVRLWTDNGLESPEARACLDAAVGRLSGPVSP